MTSTSHSNILKLLGFFETGVRTYMVLELAPGGDLHGVFRHARPFAERRAARAIIQGVAGVHHCHEQGVIHRDIKVTGEAAAAQR